MDLISKTKSKKKDYLLYFRNNLYKKTKSINKYILKT